MTEQKMSQPYAIKISNLHLYVCELLFQLNQWGSVTCWCCISQVWELEGRTLHILPAISNFIWYAIRTFKRISPNKIHTDKLCDTKRFLSWFSYGFLCLCIYEICRYANIWDWHLMLHNHSVRYNFASEVQARGSRFEIER